MNPLPFILATVIFSVASIGGLVALRVVTNLALRAILFLALCYALAAGTFWLADGWDLDVFEIGAAWTVALLVVVGVEGMRAWRRGRSPAL